MSGRPSRDGPADTADTADTAEAAVIADGWVVSSVLLYVKRLGLKRHQTTNLSRRLNAVYLNLISVIFLHRNVH